MFHIVICDDDDCFIDYMKRIILKCGIKPEEVLFYTYLSGDDFINYLVDVKLCDLLILDMQMKGKDGMQTAVEFRRKFPNATLAFCSGVYRPTDESFKVTPFRYLFKSYTEEKMVNEMCDVVHEMRRKENGVQIVAEHYKDVILLKPEDILYIEITRTGSNIHVCDPSIAQGEPLKSKKRLKELFAQLQPYGFEMPHNSYIVNLSYIMKIRANREILMKNDTVLTVARSKQKEFWTLFTEWISKKY